MPAPFLTINTRSRAKSRPFVRHGPPRVLPYTVVGVPGDDLDVAVVTLWFHAIDAERLGAILARYVVLTRGAQGCRNVDLCASVTRPNRLLVIEKWESREAQRAHFDSAVAVEMAEAAKALLAEPPDIDLWDGVSAHDLR